MARSTGNWGWGDSHAERVNLLLDNGQIIDREVIHGACGWLGQPID
jgi:hypothetical protein